MTTGRINQVTIVRGRGVKPCPCPSKRAESVKRRDARTRPAGRGRLDVSQIAPAPAIRLPPLDSPRRGSAEEAGGTHRDLGISVSEGGSPSPVTSEDGYRYTDVPPNASVLTLTIGQQPTGSPGATPLRSKGAGFRGTPSLPPGSARTPTAKERARGQRRRGLTRRDSAMAVSVSG